MKKIEASSPEAHSANLLANNIAQLKALFPELVTEGAKGAAINVDVLKALVGDATATEADEKYGLNWHGKRRARQLALTPSTGTLRPCPDESVDWDNTQNLMIEGDNLEVLKLLQKSYAGKVKMIYIDPPYNTGKDFVYRDNFQDNIKNYLQLTGQVDGGKKISSNTDASGRFHTDWLNMMYPRLKLARSLLQEDGVLLVSVDDAEIDHMKSILADIFGEENILAILIWNKQHSQQQGIFKRYHEYVLVVAKHAALIGNIEGGKGEIDAGALKKISAANPASTFNFPAGVRFDAADEYELLGTYGESEQVTVVSGRLVCKNGKTAFPVTLSAGWTQKNQMLSWFSGKETYDTKDQKVVEFYFTGTGKLKCIKERSKITPSSLLPEYGMVSEQTAYLAQLMGAAVFQNPKPVKMIEDFISWFANPRDLVMDFFSGSGTTGESVFKRNFLDGGNRRYILVQLPEPLDPTNSDQKAAADFCDQLEKPRTIAELTKERLRRAAIKIRASSASPTCATGQLDLTIQPALADKPLDLGFRVFKLDHSNIRAWNPDRDDLAQTLLDHEDHILADRDEDDVVYELLLKLGLDLCVPMQSQNFAGKTVSAIGGGVLMTCLAEEILTSDVEALAQSIVAWHKELAPSVDTTCVFLDSAFENDVAKTNLAAILEQYGIQNVRSV